MKQLNLTAGVKDNSALLVSTSGIMRPEEQRTRTIAYKDLREDSTSAFKWHFACYGQLAIGNMRSVKDKKLLVVSRSGTSYGFHQGL